jgi:hypothetical protein
MQQQTPVVDLRRKPVEQFLIKRKNLEKTDDFAKICFNFNKIFEPSLLQLSVNEYVYPGWVTYILYFCQ